MNVGQKRVDYKLTHLFFILSLLTASFDILLNLEINDASYRFSLVMQIIFIFSAVVAGGVSKKSSGSPFIQPLAFSYLVIWGMFLVLWTPRTYHLGFSIGYTGWFLICVAVVFAAVQYYGHDRKQALQISRIYINIYVFIAAFGLLQFVLGVLGVELLITQWWIAGRLPRLNGFSYEPSYYATYLITGWGMLAWLVERRVYLYSKNYTHIAFVIVSLALVLSSSRMGILIVIGYFAYYILKNLLSIVFRARINIRFLKLMAFCAGLAVLAIGAVLATTGFKSLTFLLFGTGLGGTADHSASIRWGQFEDTIDMFLASPIVGYGLGGLWSYLAVKQSLPLDEVTGMNVTAEVLASTGILGFPFFILFIGTLIFGSFRFIKTRTLESELLAAAGVGFILLFVILQFNQSIIRIYLWNHIAIMAVLYHYVRQANARIPVRSLRQRNSQHTVYA